MINQASIVIAPTTVKFDKTTFFNKRTDYSSQSSNVSIFHNKNNPSNVFNNFEYTEYLD